MLISDKKEENAMEKNLTTGSVFKNVILFSLPYLLSYFLQTLYGMADLFIIGQYDGVASTTAVSVGSQIMHMITVMIVGLAMGTTVSIAQAIGADNKKQASKAVGNTIVLFMGVAIVGMALLLMLVHPIVSVMSTPAEAVNGTVTYLTICFIGIPFITAYNIISAIFRGMGDSKSPMYFIAVACIANIVLDYLFMGALKLGPAGAALGTTISQAISVLVSVIVIIKRKSVVLSKTDFIPHGKVMGYSNCCAGWPDSGCFYCDNDYCKPERIKRCSCRWHCRENYKLSVSGSVFYVINCFSSWGTEYRSK